MLKTKVIASSIKNLTDARYFAAWEVSFLSFNIENGNEHYIGPQDIAAIKEWVEGTDYILEVGAFPQLDVIQQLSDYLDIKNVLVAPFCNIDIISELQEKEYRVFKEIIINNKNDFEGAKKEIHQLSQLINTFILDIKANHIDNDYIQFLSEISPLKNCYININVPAEQLENLLEKTKVTGIVVKGGEEEKVGYKSFDDIDDIFEALEIFI